VSVTKYNDGSYLGDKMEFLGIFNRMICLKQLEPTFTFMKDNVVKLHLDQWRGGWQFYKIPDFN